MIIVASRLTANPLGTIKVLDGNFGKPSHPLRHPSCNSHKHTRYARSKLKIILYKLLPLSPPVILPVEINLCLLQVSPKLHESLDRILAYLVPLIIEPLRSRSSFAFWQQIRDPPCRKA